MDDSPDTNQPPFLNSSLPAEVSDNLKPRPAHRIRSLTRLAVGGVEVGIDELFRLLQIWEGRAQEEGLSDQRAGSVAGVDLNSSSQDASKKALRFALIGLIFEAQERIERESRTFGQIGKIFNHWAIPWTRPIKAIYHSQFTAPVRSRFERWVARGEAETARWVDTGRVEDAHSRRLARIAFDQSVDEYIEYLTSNPEVQELVQKQSTGLANEVIEEVRERTVSADNLLEGIARSFLHRVPRTALPEPSPALRKIAAPRPMKSKGDNK